MKWLSREGHVPLRELLDNLPFGLVVLDRDGSIREANPALAGILGLPDHEELFGRSMLEFWSDPPSRLRWLEALTERELVTDYEVELERGDGQVIWVRIQAKALRDLSGEVVGCEGTIEDVTDRRSVDEDRRKLLAKLVRSQEEERQRIANDIHDDSIQVMTAVGMRLHSIERNAQDPDLAEALMRLEEIVDLSIGRLRHQLFELRPPTLDREGLAPALHMYLEQMQQSGGPAFRLVDRLIVEPPLEIRASLYRIAQEALTNVRKHARASFVTVTMEAWADGVLVRVADDGAGFAVESEGQTRPGHLGLTAIRERAEMAGGWSEVRSEHGAGTTVQFWVPVRDERVESALSHG
jgi:PAS domain S-box-containing protein